MLPKTLKMIYSKQDVEGVWSKLRSSAGWTYILMENKLYNFFRTALRAAHTRSEIKPFSGGWTFSQDYRSNFGRFLVVANFSVEELPEVTQLCLVNIAAYSKIWGDGSSDNHTSENMVVVKPFNQDKLEK